MPDASFTLDPAFAVAPVNRRTFGSFVEHMGRAVYTGIFEPGHPEADADGLRQDVLGLARELGVTTVRYPGGNFVSGYRWEDGVGPVGSRPTRLDTAWHSVEPNTFGLDEFARWAEKAGVEPMMAVNLGTRGPAEALDLLEYCNHPGGTHLSDLRREHGRKEPYGIRMWCLGNEMDGPWQLGHRTAAEYGRVAEETARAMRMLDPDLELVACGSSARDMPTFGAWEATVLEHAYEQVDFISAHAYYEVADGDLASFLGSAVDMDRFIDEVVATCDHVRAKKSSRKRINVSFDEWNVWYLRALQNGGMPTGWEQAPRVSEEPYTAVDAVVAGSLLITLLRHSDRVTAACHAQLVNTLAAIRTEPGGPAWRQTVFHPFAHTARLARGTVLHVDVRTPVHETAVHGDVPLVDAVATSDEETGEVTVFVVNRSPDRALELAVDVRAFGGLRVAEQVRLHDEDPSAVNTEADPDRVVARPVSTAAVDGGTLRDLLPPVSWTAVRLAPAR